MCILPIIIQKTFSLPISQETEQKNKENYLNNNTKNVTSQRIEHKRIFFRFYGEDDKIIQNSQKLFKGKKVGEKYVNSCLEKNKEEKENNIMKLINKKMKEKMIIQESQRFIDLKMLLMEMFCIIMMLIISYAILRKHEK